MKVSLDITERLLFEIETRMMLEERTRAQMMRILIKRGLQGEYKNER